MIRPDWDSYFMNIAMIVATRATCPRASVGAVITKNNRIVATGYNGALPGEPHCSDEGCILGKNLENGVWVEHCLRAKHAEENAIRYTRKFRDTFGATLYVTRFPCFYKCRKLILWRGISKIVYCGNVDENSFKSFKFWGIKLKKMEMDQ